MTEKQNNLSKDNSHYNATYFFMTEKQNNLSKGNSHYSITYFAMTEKRNSLYGGTVAVTEKRDNKNHRMATVNALTLSLP